MPTDRNDNLTQQLATELANQGRHVYVSTGYRRVRPLWRAWRQYSGASVPHLHWLNPYLRGNNVSTQSLYAFGIRSDVTLILRHRW